MANKIKVFKFLVSNYGYLASEQFNKNTGYKVMDVCSQEDIEYTINDFLDCNGELIDLKINTNEINKHNNGGSNKVELIYTIIYKPS